MQEEILELRGMQVQHLAVFMQEVKEKKKLIIPFFKRQEKVDDVLRLTLNFRDISAEEAQMVMKECLHLKETVPIGESTAECHAAKNDTILEVS